MHRILLLLVLGLSGCETIFQREVRFEAEGMNYQPIVDIDISQMPEGSIELIREHGEIEVRGNSLQVYRLHTPVKITVEPIPHTLPWIRGELEVPERNNTPMD